MDYLEFAAGLTIIMMAVYLRYSAGLRVENHDVLAVLAGWPIPYETRQKEEKEWLKLLMSEHNSLRLG